MRSVIGRGLRMTSGIIPVSLVRLQVVARPMRCACGAPVPEDIHPLLCFPQTIYFFPEKGKGLFTVCGFTRKYRP